MACDTSRRRNGFQTSLALELLEERALLSQGMISMGNMPALTAPNYAPARLQQAFCPSEAFRSIRPGATTIAAAANGGGVLPGGSLASAVGTGNTGMALYVRQVDIGSLVAVPPTYPGPSGPSSDTGPGGDLSIQQSQPMQAIDLVFALGNPLNSAGLGR